MTRLLVLGYGNVDRRDDGVALHVVNALRERLGQPPIDPHETDGLEMHESDLDTGFVYQLTPELAQVAAEYDHVVFVDAHISRHEELIRQVPVAAEARPTVVSHQLSPGTVLAVGRELYGGNPTGTLLSIRGHDFDFGTGLSPDTAAGVEPAVNRIWAMYQAAS
jgi:hydrogenase maturation protease